MSRQRPPGLRRRALLATPLAAPLAAPIAAIWGLAACGRDEAALVGGWLDDSATRGHRLLQTDKVSAQSTEPQRCAVAVVGAGVAGLAAARALMQAGVDDLVVFDLEDEAGGNARGHSMGGLACPRGAHYLPMPGPHAHEVRDWLFELGLLRTHLGRTVADERHLCHSPQERLWMDGQWVDGVVPPAAPGSSRLLQYQRFSKLVQEASRNLGFAMPSQRAPWRAGHAALDAVTFAHWLNQQGLRDPGLRWYLDYCCRDDYGANADAVSAWAGLHYFGSRHGFAASAEESPERDAVFTWPEGNSWLTRRLAAPLGERLRTGQLVRRIDVQRHGVELQVLPVGATTPSAGGAGPQTWIAQQVVVALPLHVARRLISPAPAALAPAAELIQHAPWLVANLQLDGPLTDKPGAPPSWDNVLYGDDGAAPTGDAAYTLGYVDAMHQSLRPVPGPTVLTAYWALGARALGTGTLGAGASGDSSNANALAQRQALHTQPWQFWAQRVVNDLSRAHPDLPRRTQRIDLVRYGHAMAMPAPGVRGSVALQALAAPADAPRLQFAHSDLAGYSVFEEAFTLGHQAGQTAARRLHGAGLRRAG